MTEEMMSLDEVAKECKEAAEYLASQPGEGYDLDTLMRDKNLEFEESLSKAEKRLVRANEIENLECLAAHLERLPRHSRSSLTLSRRTTVAVTTCRRAMAHMTIGAAVAT